MRLNFFYADTTEEANSACISAIGTVPKDENAIVIIPDRFSLSVEKDIFEKLRLKASFNIEVVSFSRLASRLTSGGKFLSKEGTVMLMKKVIKSLDGRLLYFRRFNSIGFAKEMFAAQASLRSSGVSAETLRSLAESASVNREKYLDMALILEEYDNALKENYTDTISRLDALASAIEESEVIHKSHIFILGFNIFSAKQKQIIIRLIHKALSVTLCGVNTSPTGYEFPSREFISAAEEMGASVTEKYISAKLKYPFNILRERLFTNFIKQGDVYEGESIRIFACKTPEEELVSAAREILRLIKGGLRFKEIAVALPDASYLSAVKRVFTRFNIPYFSDEGYNASHSAIFKFISLLFEAEITGLRRDKVVQLAKHPYLGIADSDAELFESYCLKYNISHTRFLQEFSLGDLEEKEPAESVRKAVAEVLICRECAFANEKINEILEKVKKYHKPLAGTDILVKASAQCEERVITLLKEIQALLGDEEANTEEIYSVFSAGASGFEIKLAPQNLDSVFIGNTNESRFSGLKALFILGANDGFFPAKASEQAIITNTDFLLFEKSGISVSPTPIETNRLEQFVLSDLICRAETLYIGYSKFSQKGEEKSESEGVKTIRRLLSPKVYDSAGEGGLCYLLGTQENAYFQYLSGLIPKEKAECVREFLQKRNYRFFTENNFTGAGERLSECFISPSGETMSSSVSQIQKYFSCPFSHFLAYGLRLKEREESKLKVMDIGIIIHKALELYFKRTKGKLKELPQNELNELAATCAEEALREERIFAVSPSPVERNTFQRLKDECISIIQRLTGSAKNSLFQPEFIELAFGYSEPCEVGGLKLRGKVDRVDTCGKKMVVIDYKTGKTSSETSYAHIFYGEKIQPYVYLKALSEKGYLPAGAVYLPLTDGYSKNGADYRYNGQFEKSLQTFSELDIAFGEAIKNKSKESCSVFKVKTDTKNGGFYLSPDTNLLTREEFYRFCDYADSLIRKAAEEIRSGYIAPSPLKTGQTLSCTYCPYVSLCEEEKREIRVAEKTSKYNILDTIPCSGGVND